MRLHKVAGAALAAWATLAVVSACGDASSTSAGADGGPGDGGVGTPSDGAVVQGNDGSYALTSLDDVCDNGPTGRQIFTFVRPRYDGTFTPPPASRPGAPPWTGPTTPSALTLSATYTNGKIVCTPRQSFNCPPGAPCAAPPPPHVEVDLDFAFKTADGLFDEHFTATASFSRDDSQVSLSGVLPAANLVGTYPIAAGSAADVHLAFEARFGVTGASGPDANGSISEMTSSLSFGGGSWTASASPDDGGLDAADSGGD
jgi:hypothetical protein